MRLYRGKLAVVTAEKPDAAALLEEAEELLRRAGFDDSYGTERRKLSAEDAARLAEAERIVNEAAREKELLQEEAMLRGGGKEIGGVPEKAEDVVQPGPEQTIRFNEPKQVNEAGRDHKTENIAIERPEGEAARVDPRNVWTKIKTRGTVKIQHGISAFPEHELIANRVRRVSPIAGYFDFGCHGSPTSVAFGSREPNMSPSLLAEYIRHHPDYTPGESIRLLSCSTGKPLGTEYCFAEELANIMGVDVMAPSDTLYIAYDGTLSVGFWNRGKMIVYKPNDRRRLR